MIKRRKPIPRRSKRKSRIYPDGREELRGADKSNRHDEIFERAGGRCEEIKKYRLQPFCMSPSFKVERRCNAPATEWSHKPCIHIKVGNGHGRGFKCDAMSCGIASCRECHKKAHGQ